MTAVIPIIVPKNDNIHPDKQKPREGKYRYACLLYGKEIQEKYRLQYP